MVVAQRIDSLLANWAVDFAREAQLKTELQSAIARVDTAKSDKTVKFLSDADADLARPQRSRRSIDQLLAEKLETIDQLEQRIDIQHVEILSRELSSSQAAERQRRSDQTSRRAVRRDVPAHC